MHRQSTARCCHRIFNFPAANIQGHLPGTDSVLETNAAADPKPADPGYRLGMGDQLRVTACKETVLISITRLTRIFDFIGEGGGFHWRGRGSIWRMDVDQYDGPSDCAWVRGSTASTSNTHVIGDSTFDTELQTGASTRRALKADCEFSTAMQVAYDGRRQMPRQ